MTDFETIKQEINTLAAEHERKADECAREATEHMTEANALRTLAAMIERHARTTAGA